MNTEASETHEFVTYHRDGHVGFITLNRPEKLNSLNLAVWYSLDRALAASRRRQGSSSRDRPGCGQVFLCRFGSQPGQ